MTDARIDVEFPGHFKTKKLIRRLGVVGAWHLLCLWLWTAANKPSGSLAGIADEDIEVAAEWPGEPGAFVAALLEVKYLAGRSGSRHLHDWAEHNPWAFGSGMRTLKARWNAVKKHHGQAQADEQVPEWARIRADAEALKRTSDAVARADSMPAAGPQEGSQQTSSSAPSPSPSPSQKKEASRTESVPSRGSRLPAGWEPPVELYVWAKREAPGIDHKRELESFRDYWAAQPGSKGVKLDWDATYRNWIRRSGGQHATGTGKRGNGRGQGSVVDDTAEAVAQRALERKQRGELF